MKSIILIVYGLTLGAITYFFPASGFGCEEVDSIHIIRCIGLVGANIIVAIAISVED